MPAADLLTVVLCRVFAFAVVVGVHQMVYLRDASVTMGCQHGGFAQGRAKVCDSSKHYPLCKGETHD